MVGKWILKSGNATEPAVPAITSAAIRTRKSQSQVPARMFDLQK